MLKTRIQAKDYRDEGHFEKKRKFNEIWRKLASRSSGMVGDVRGWYFV